MVKGLEQAAKLKGDRLKLIPVEHLLDCKEEILKFQQEEELNGFQNWIVDELYQFTVPKADFEIKSILLIALVNRAHAEVEFQWQGKKYNFKSLVVPDFDEAKERYSSIVEGEGYHLMHADNLPMKRLSAQSGLGAYGRNNVTYVEGLGSYFLYDAYFTDIPAPEDTWGTVQNREECVSCMGCRKNCPTGAILQERFLIDNQRCLSAINEMPGDFPEWLPKSVHHTLYDCLRCQEICPINIPFQNNILRGISFNETETALLLGGAPYEEFSPEMKEKSNQLGLNRWLAAIPRNLKVLLDQE
jgi:epoxyqueuosine reductase